MLSGLWTPASIKFVCGADSPPLIKPLSSQQVTDADLIECLSALSDVLHQGADKHLPPLIKQVKEIHRKKDLSLYTKSTCGHFHWLFVELITLFWVVFLALCGRVSWPAHQLPHSQGFLAEHLHLVPIPLSYLILPPFAIHSLLNHVTEFIIFTSSSLHIQQLSMTFFWHLPYIKNKEPSPNEGRGTVFIIHFHYFLFLFLVLFYFHLASHLGLDELIYWMVEEVGHCSRVLHTCGGSGSHHAK